jgi:hypothetical protein
MHSPVSTSGSKTHYRLNHVIEALTLSSAEQFERQPAHTLGPSDPLQRAKKGHVQVFKRRGGRELSDEEGGGIGQVCRRSGLLQSSSGGG